WKASALAKSMLLNDSRARLQEWVDRYGLDCDFRETGEDYIYRDPRAFAHGQQEIGLLRELGVDVEVIDGATCEAQEPALKPGVAGAIRCSGDAALRPDRYVAELARVVRERGGVIIEDNPLQSLSHEPDGIALTTANGPMHARDVLLASGAWSHRLGPA